MSDVLVFSVGAVVFVATASATLLYGYLRFNELQEEDATTDVSVG